MQAKSKVSVEDLKFNNFLFEISQVQLKNQKKFVLKQDLNSSIWSSGDLIRLKIRCKAEYFVQSWKDASVDYELRYSPGSTE